MDQVAPTLSILIASSGRRSLGATLDSIYPQMRPGDELIVDVNDDAPWGHRARNRMMPRAKGDALVFLDDDDFYLPGAFDKIRARFAEVPDRVHIFKMRYADGREIWVDRHLWCGNVSTQMFAVPNSPRLACWENRYEGDFDFLRGTCMVMGDPIWHEDVIAIKGEG